MRARAFAYGLGALAATTMLCGPVVPAHAQTPGKKSNVIVIFGHDAGWGDLGAYGGGASIGSELPEFVTPTS